MKTLLARSVCLVAALHLLGGHWLAMQSVAWVTMIVDFSRDASLVEAVGKTFDGEHPCALCKTVASGQEEERERQSTLADPLAKLVAVIVAAVPVPSLPSSDELRYFPFGANPRSVDDSLPSPPPWSA